MAPIRSVAPRRAARHHHRRWRRTLLRLLRRYVVRTTARFVARKAPAPPAALLGTTTTTTSTTSTTTSPTTTTTSTTTPPPPVSRRTGARTRVARMQRPQHARNAAPKLPLRIDASTHPPPRPRRDALCATASTCAAALMNVALTGPEAGMVARQGRRGRAAPAGGRGGNVRLRAFRHPFQVCPDYRPRPRGH